MAIRKNSARYDMITYTASDVKEFIFRDTKPNVIQIQNMGTASVYISAPERPNTSATNFDIQIVTLGKNVWTVPAGITKMYIYSTANATLHVNSFESDELYSADLDKTQETIITNSTTTSAVTIADGGDVALGGKGDTYSIDHTATKSVVSLIKGALYQLAQILTKIPTALTAGGNFKVAIQEGIPAGTNVLGYVQIISQAGKTLDNFRIGDAVVPANDYGLAVLGLQDDNTFQMIKFDNSGNTKVVLQTGANTIGNVGLVAGSASIGTVGLNAGSNTIGNVGLNAGTNNIGDVDVLTLPASNVPASAVTIYNVTCTNANTEYSQALPSNTKKVVISIQDGLSANNYRVAFATGKVATPTAPYLKFNQSVEYSTPDMYMSSGTIYFASSLAGVVAQVECWT